MILQTPLQSMATSQAELDLLREFADMSTRFPSINWHTELAEIEQFELQLMDSSDTLWVQYGPHKHWHVDLLNVEADQLYETMKSRGRKRKHNDNKQLLIGGKWFFMFAASDTHEKICREAYAPIEMPGNVIASALYTLDSNGKINATPFCGQKCTEPSLKEGRVALACFYTKMQLVSCKEPHGNVADNFASEESAVNQAANVTEEPQRKRKRVVANTSPPNPWTAYQSMHKHYTKPMGKDLRHKLGDPESETAPDGFNASKFANWEEKVKTKIQHYELTKLHQQLQADKVLHSYKFSATPQTAFQGSVADVDALVEENVDVIKQSMHWVQAQNGSKSKWRVEMYNYAKQKPISGKSAPSLPILLQVMKDSIEEGVMTRLPRPKKI